jgi:hypothetical protein
VVVFNSLNIKWYQNRHLAENVVVLCEQLLEISDYSEALACRETLLSGVDLLLSKVIIASYCKGVVDDINNKKGGCYPIVIKEIDLSARVLFS